MGLPDITADCVRECRECSFGRLASLSDRACGFKVGKEEFMERISSFFGEGDRRYSSASAGASNAD